MVAKSYNDLATTTDFIFKSFKSYNNLVKMVAKSYNDLATTADLATRADLVKIVYKLFNVRFKLKFYNNLDLCVRVRARFVFYRKNVRIRRGHGLAKWPNATKGASTF